MDSYVARHAASSAVLNEACDRCGLNPSGNDTDGAHPDTLCQACADDDSHANDQRRATGYFNGGMSA